ncbi:MAG TPA: pyridoxal phosphate-dependent aminotransferase [Chloroflexi bacterium]|nr:pyridoxal phosphate-dependent aminotransferase [Chloroflexota bacterium]
MTIALERKKSDKLAAVGGVGIRTKLLDITAKLDDVVLMGRGDPDLPTPPHIIEAAKRALDNGATHYTHVRGNIELRRAIAEKLKRDNNLDYDPETEIMVTVGAEEAVFLAMYALLNEGDEVLVCEPRYTSYDEAILMWGGKPVVVPCDPDEDFLFKPENIRKAITPRTKVISLVNPGNPIGMLDPEVVEEIAKIAIEHDLIVISDEIYENIIFDGTKHLSMAAVPGMRERTITVNGPSKSYAMTGWRCGFLAAPAPICEMLTEPAHTIAICCPAVTQAAALAAYTGPQEPVRQMREIYNERRVMMMKALDEMGLKYVNPRAGFYLFTDVTSLGMDPETFCTRLLQEARVLVFPGSLFADPTNRFVRISLLSPTARIEEAIRRMKQFVASVKA